jgi:hypothetical protein
LLSDNGEMLAHLEAVGVPVGRRVATLRDRVARLGLTLGDQGDVRVLVPAEQGAHVLATAISGLLSVAEWEREQVGLDEQTQNLAEEACRSRRTDGQLPGPAGGDRFLLDHGRR